MRASSLTLIALAAHVGAARTGWMGRVSTWSSATNTRPCAVSIGRRSTFEAALP